jgi:hypothetical protein
MGSRIAAGVAVLLLTAGLAGCGGHKRPNFGSDDGLKIAELIDLLVDDASSARRAQTLFAREATPKAAGLRKYGKYTFNLDGNPTVTGDTATATVHFRRHTGQEVGAKEWTFVKEGAEWKIKSAPLP